MKIKMAIAGLISCFIFATTQTFATTTNPSLEPSKKININTADVKQLSKSIKGIGQKRAEAIIKYRENHQGFKSLQELKEVPGLGQNFVSIHLKEIEQTFILQ